MKYISQPPLLLNVHMHNPTVSVRSWMDSLLAFFPGLQVRDPPLITFTTIESQKGSVELHTCLWSDIHFSHRF